VQRRQAGRSVPQGPAVGQPVQRRLDRLLPAVIGRPAPSDAGLR
jgi:hypothetical protein